MDYKKEILNILNAVDEINLKPRKKNLNRITSHFATAVTPISTPKLSHDNLISPDVDKLIREAEEYKKILAVSPEIVSSKDQSILTKSKETLILTEEHHDSYKSLNQKNIDLKNKIKNLEDKERELQIQIKDFQKNELELSKNLSPLIESTHSEDFIISTKENLKNIYTQVEQQKKIFLDLKNYSKKVKRDSNVYKENYEKLIIENHELKTRLKITNDQIVNYEDNKKDLMLAIHNLNEIISKSNIVGNISPQESTNANKPKKVTKIDSVD